MKTAIILFQCEDQKGIVAKISNFILEKDGNIIDADQHSTNPINGHFFIRIEFCFDEKNHAEAIMEQEFELIASEFNADWKIYYKNKKNRMGILVSKPDHCLFNILYRWKSGEFNVEIPFVISNCPEHKSLVKQFGIKFYYIKATKEDKKEKEILKIISDKTDFLVLARYMQILSPEFLNSYNKDIINIHHSFLPCFKGAAPYSQAFEKGVKVVGATAHYVTANLDEGPIIEQMVEKISHKDTVDALKEKGKNLENMAIAKAIQYYTEHRVIKYQNKTIVF